MTATIIPFPAFTRPAEAGGAGGAIRGAGEVVPFDIVRATRPRPMPKRRAISRFEALCQCAGDEPPTDRTSA
jgi:hypothetical protein